MPIDNVDDLESLDSLDDLPDLEDLDGLDNTGIHLIRTLAEARQLGANLMEGNIGLHAGKQEVRRLRRQFDWARSALMEHLRRREIDGSDCEYLIATTYTGEAPIVLALGIAKLDTAVDRAYQAELWDKMAKAELSVIRELAQAARMHIHQARKSRSRRKWLGRLIGATFERFPRRPLPRVVSRILGDVGVATTLDASERPRRVPLGFGDLEFKIHAAVSALIQLCCLESLPAYLLSPKDADLADNDYRALRAIEDVAHRFYKGEFFPEVAGTLPQASGVALAKAEILLSRVRLSQGALLATLKIHLLRAVGYLAHCIVAERYDKMQGTNREPEQQRALRMARWSLRNFRDIERQYGRLWLHDLRWRVLGASLRVDLRGYGVLEGFSIKDVSELATGVEEAVALAEARIM